MACMSLPTPTLHTARLRLRVFKDADANALFELHSSAYVLRYWDAPPWSDRVRAERFITACRQMAEEGTGARLAVDRASDGAFIGWCSLTRWDPDYRSASMGYCFDDAAWGHGYATEAARALLKWAFDTLDLNRVQAETDTRNAASARVLEKLGFVREGTLREDCVVNGEVSDSWVYGLISGSGGRRPSRVPPAESLLARETAPGLRVLRSAELMGPAQCTLLRRRGKGTTADQGAFGRSRALEASADRFDRWAQSGRRSSPSIAQYVTASAVPDADGGTTLSIRQRSMSGRSAVRVIRHSHPSA